MLIHIPNNVITLSNDILSLNTCNKGSLLLMPWASGQKAVSYGCATIAKSVVELRKNKVKL